LKFKQTPIKVIIMNLVKYEQDGLELWVDESTGLAYAHQSAICRMMPDAPRTTIQRRLQGCPSEVVKMAEILTAGGMQRVPIYPSSVVFKLAIEFNLELAEAMGSCGANVYMLGQAGYKVKVAEPAPIANNVTPLLAQQAAGVADVVRHISDTLSGHPRLAQLLIDASMNTIVEKQPVFGKSMRGVVEVANEMGYKVDRSSRVKLGKFIVGRGHQSTKESRLCEGRMTPINCYEDTPELRESIREYFS
jgi:hypothetical protein